MKLATAIALTTVTLLAARNAAAQSYPNVLCCNSATLACTNAGGGSPSPTSCPNPSGSAVELAVSVTATGGATLLGETSEPTTGFVGMCIAPNADPGTNPLPTVCYQVVPSGGLGVNPSGDDVAVTLGSNLTVSGVFAGQTDYVQALTECYPHPAGSCPQNAPAVSRSCCGAGLTFVSTGGPAFSDANMPPPACQGVGTGIEASPDSAAGLCPSGQVNRLTDSFGNFCCALPLPPCSGVGTGVEASPDTAAGSCPAGETNTGTLRDSSGNYCCSNPTVVTAPVPAVPRPMLAGLTAALMALGIVLGSRRPRGGRSA